MSGILEISVRLLVALLLGGVIGIEREFRAKDAGFRTHFLVCVGSALFCVVSQYGFGDAAKDASRVAAQVVSGTVATHLFLPARRLKPSSLTSAPHAKVQPFFTLSSITRTSSSRGRL